MCRLYEKTKSYYKICYSDYIFKSSSIDCFISKKSNSIIVAIAKNKIISKGFIIELDDSVIFMNLLHM